MYKALMGDCDILVDSIKIQQKSHVQIVRSPGSDISLFLLLRFIAILIRFIELLYHFIELLLRYIEIIIAI